MNSTKWPRAAQNDWHDIVRPSSCNTWQLLLFLVHIIYLVTVQRYFLWCGHAGSSLEVKIETDSNDAVGMKTEADSITFLTTSPAVC